MNKIKIFVRKIKNFFINFERADNEVKIICPYCGLAQHRPSGYDYQRCTGCKKYMFDYRCSL